MSIIIGITVLRMWCSETFAVLIFCGLILNTLENLTELECIGNRHLKVLRICVQTIS
jgi:hypothetical protein